MALRFYFFVDRMFDFFFPYFEVFFSVETNAAHCRMAKEIMAITSDSRSATQQYWAVCWSIEETRQPQMVHMKGAID